MFEASLCVVFASPRSLELRLKEMSAMECARTRADMLCMLEICSGLGYLISYSHPTAPITFLGNRLLKGSCWFSLFLHCPFWFLFSLPSEAVFVKITKCHSNGHSFVFLLLNSVTTIHIIVIPFPDLLVICSA